MKWYNWTKEFEDETITEDIPGKMRSEQATFATIQIVSTCGMILCLILAGISILSGPIRAEALFVGGAVACMIALAGSRIRLDIRLAMYQIMMEWRRNISGELRKSEAEDL